MAIRFDSARKFSGYSDSKLANLPKFPWSIMESPSFSISFPTDFWTRYRANLALMHRLPGTWFAYAFFVGVPTLCLIASFVLGIDLSKRDAFDLPGWVLLSGGYLFMFVLMPLLQMYLLWSGTRRNRTLLGLQHQVLTSEGFSASGETFKTTLKWDAFQKAVETKYYFFLYLSSRSAFFIPKAQIPSALELDRLRNVLKTYLGNRVRLPA